MVGQRVSAVRPDDIRQHNLSLVLHHLHRDGALTRAELTQRLQLSRSTVKALVADLAQLGLVEEVVPSGGERVGRPSHVVAPHAHGPYAVGVDLDIEHVTVAAVGIGGLISARELIPFGHRPATPEQLVTLVRDALPRLHAAVPGPGRMCGVGVSVPGTVDLDTGHVGIAPNLGWDDVPLGAMLAAALPADLPIVLGNDADLAVLAEHQRGNARDSDDVVFLMGRIGIGAGIIIGGVAVHGRNGHAGELGHNVLDTNGPLCHCGKRGCIETFLGEAALLALADRSLPSTEATVTELFEDARAGVPDAVRAVESAAEPLGRAIANLMNLLDPEKVLLGGTLGEVLKLARPEVQAAVDRYTFGAPSPAVTLALPAFGTDSALLGAAEVAFTELLADPR